MKLDQIKEMLCGLPAWPWEDEVINLIDHGFIAKSPEIISQLVAQLDIAKKALEEIDRIPWGYDGDCGASRITTKALAEVQSLEEGK